MMPRAQFNHCIALFALLALAVACSRDSVPRLPRLAQDATLLAFGDSLTFGTGTTPDQSYPAVLQALVGRRVINAGIPGDTTAGGRARLAEALDEHEPQLVILCLGGNDMLRRQDRQQMRANLEAMSAEIRSRGLSLILLGVPEPVLIGLESDPVYAELATTLKVPIENDIIASVLSDSALKSDRIHPNAQGYRKMAEAVARLLNAAGAV